MVKFQCQRCGYETDYKANLKHHLTKKRPCISINSNDITPQQLLQELYPVTTKEYICTCGKKYSHCSGLSVHKRNCIINLEHKTLIRMCTRLVTTLLEQKSKAFRNEQIN